MGGNSLDHSTGTAAATMVAGVIHYNGWCLSELQYGGWSPVVTAQAQHGSNGTAGGAHATRTRLQIDITKVVVCFGH